MSSTSLPTTIRAVLQPDIQSTDLILTSLPFQSAKPNTDEHVIKVHATAPCAGELLWGKNFPDSVLKPGKILVPCYDLSGEVITAPPNSPFPPGTEIYTRTPAHITGNAREYTVAKTAELAAKPANLSWEEAASIPLSTFTAYQALFEHGELKLGWKDAAGRAENAKKRVLITAGAGGVGVIAVQLARAAGVGSVIAITGTSNVEFVKSLGATEVIDYRKTSLGEWARAQPKVDLVFDMLGGQTLADAWTAVREGGILLGIREPPEMRKPSGVAEGIRDSFFIMESKGEQLAELAPVIESGDLKPVVDSVFPLEEFKEAFAKVEGGHSRGKVIIKI
ncbi:NAD(P)-binding protein [Eremomyces bilateralis CBS 781.70]|uniref:NAD(P)-binding protein n=1 Tax=Eremomyces bilateralis CBS 781.70 TaxID=1392243 RepID=A0A6G1G9K3_9PEZI|nr:NAD(P)-binding protein [Eremomyces bilateralis CBS 781.70]KAF1814704.1 NAD(P)-binding protein [Eremomyces bilateralis CBS 781.70]